MTTLRLTNYKRKGIYAYLSPVTVKNGKINRDGFINGTPVDENDNKDRYFRGKASLVEFDLIHFSNGWYEFKEASGHRATGGFIKIENGEICDELETNQELIEKLNPIVETLPEIIGTERQIKWACDIRAKFLRSEKAKKINPERLTKIKNQCDAKWWIENREKLS